MSHYVAIVEEASADTAAGIWFPDLPGCFSAGDTVDEAIANGAEALALYAGALERDGRPLPAPRSLAAIRSDPQFAADIRDNLVALVPSPNRTLTSAAE